MWNPGKFVLRVAKLRLNIAEPVFPLPLPLSRVRVPNNEPSGSPEGTPAELTSLVPFALMLNIMEAARRFVGVRIVAERRATTNRDRVLVVLVFMGLRFLTGMF